MPFCAKCGASMSDGAAFCGACGTNVANAASGAPMVNPVPVSGPQASGLTSNVAGALSYLAGFITGIIFLAIDPYKNDSFVRFHAFQSIFLSVAVIAVDIVLTTILPVSLYTLGLYALLWGLFRLACFILWLFCIVWAYQGKSLVLPVIGPLAQKQAGS